MNAYFRKIYKVASIIAVGITIGFAAENLSELSEIAKTGKVIYKKEGLNFLQQGSTINFYQKNPGSDTENVVGVIGLPNTTQIFLSLYENEGGTPQIGDVFTYNVDSDPKEELIVVCKWHQQHSGLNTNGFYYKVYIYGNEVVNSNGLQKVKTLDQAMQQIGEGFDGTQEGKSAVFGYKSSQEIIAKFKEHLGSLSSSHQEALKLFKSGERAKAANMLLSAIGPKPYLISASTVSIYNDLGFFLAEAGRNSEAKDVLETVLTQFPDRTVAYLNIGDVYFALKDLAKAKNAYIQYIALMKKTGKEKNIPARAIERSK